MFFEYVFGLYKYCIAKKIGLFARPLNSNISGRRPCLPIIWVNNCSDLGILFVNNIRVGCLLLFGYYVKNSSKENTRDHCRGSTIKRQRKVEENLKNISWSSFLSHENTKNELTSYFAKKGRTDFMGIFIFFFFINDHK